MTEQIIDVALYLGAIVCLIVALGIGVKRFGGVQLSMGKGMKVVTTLPLGVKEKLALVQVGSKQILVGVTPGQITRIEVFEEPILLEEPGSENTLLTRVMTPNQLQPSSTN